MNPRVYIIRLQCKPACRLHVNKLLSIPCILLLLLLLSSCILSECWKVTMTAHTLKLLMQNYCKLTSPVKELSWKSSACSGVDGTRVDSASSRLSGSSWGSLGSADYYPAVILYYYNIIIITIVIKDGCM